MLYWMRYKSTQVKGVTRDMIEAKDLDEAATSAVECLPS